MHNEEVTMRYDHILIRQDFEEKKIKYEEELRAIKSTLEEKDSKIEKVEQSLEDTKDNLQIKNQQLAALQKRAESFESERNDLTERVGELK